MDKKETGYDSYTEKCLKDLLSGLSENFIKHLNCLETALELQQMIIDAMWLLSQRFLMLKRSKLAICSRKSPPAPEQDDHKEQETLAKFKIRKEELRISNNKLSNKLETLTSSCKKFDRRLVALMVPMECMEENIDRSSIYYYIEFYTDFLNFFREVQDKLKLLESNLNIEDANAIMDYKRNTSLDPTKIENFKYSLSEPPRTDRKCIVTFY